MDCFKLFLRTSLEEICKWTNKEVNLVAPEKRRNVTVVEMKNVLVMLIGVYKSNYEDIFQL